MSYQLVRVDLLVCMPALGGRIKLEFDEFDKASRVYSKTSLERDARERRSPEIQIYPRYIQDI